MLDLCPTKNEPEIHSSTHRLSSVGWKLDRLKKVTLYLLISRSPSFVPLCRTLQHGPLPPSPASLTTQAFSRQMRPALVAFGSLLTLLGLGVGGSELALRRRRDRLQVTVRERLGVAETGLADLEEWQVAPHARLHVLLRGPDALYVAQAARHHVARYEAGENTRLSPVATLEPRLVELEPVERSELEGGGASRATAERARARAGQPAWQAVVLLSLAYSSSGEARIPKPNNPYLLLHPDEPVRRFLVLPLPRPLRPDALEAQATALAQAADRLGYGRTREAPLLAQWGPALPTFLGLVLPTWAARWSRHELWLPVQPRKKAQN